jgi:hypothetical protein
MIGYLFLFVILLSHLTQLNPDTALSLHAILVYHKIVSTLTISSLRTAADKSIHNTMKQDLTMIFLMHVTYCKNYDYHSNKLIFPKK